ncbi:hypothetical protein MKX03_015602, partial [Papaver bracteatum]
MANISSSSFSFLVILSVLLVLANNVLVSHGRLLNAPIGDISLIELANQIPDRVQDIPVKSILIFNIVDWTSLLVERVANDFDAATKSLLMVPSGSAAPGTTTIIDRLPANACNMLQNA